MLPKLVFTQLMMQFTILFSNTPKKVVLNWFTQLPTLYYLFFTKI